MKKIVLIFSLILSLGILIADLQIDVPFSQNIIGDDYSLNGAYTYESEWIIMTNTGTTTQTYTLLYAYDAQAIPEGWTISLCNPSTCYMPFFAAPIELAPGASEQLSIHIHVASTGGMEFTMTFDQGDLPEPVVLEFTFNSADNVSSEDGLIIPENSITNYPNPFNPVTNIAFNLLETSIVNLNVYNLKGELVRNLAASELPAGENIISWDGTDNRGSEVPSGTYFYKLKAGRFTSTKKMVLMK